MGSENRTKNKGCLFDTRRKAVLVKLKIKDTFWYFIVPLILSAREIVGCEYLFLFAADSTDDQTLVEYYRNILNFHDNNERAVAKPVYDFSCKFMYQEVSPLPMLQKEFFDNFNSEY